MNKANSIPIYNAVLETEKDGITCVSLVDLPAVEVDFMQFAKQQVMLHVEGNKVIGVLLRAEYPIYRLDESGQPYYIRFTREQIWTIAQKFQQTQKLESLQHDGKVIDGVKLVSLFVKDTERGINPNGFDDIADGSLFAVYQVDNKDVLDLINGGVLRGFSIEGYFGREKSKFNNMKIKSILMQFLDATKLIKVDEETTIVAADGGEIAEGKEVIYVEKEDKVVDGVYDWDGKKVTIKDGKVEKIEEVKEEKEEETTEELEGEPITREEFDALLARIDALEKIVMPNGEGEKGKPKNETLAEIKRRVFGRK